MKNKKSSYILFSLILLAGILSGCEAVEGIFKAGMWSGILLVVLAIGVLIWLASRLFRGKNSG